MGGHPRARQHARAGRQPSRRGDAQIARQGRDARAHAEPRRRDRRRHAGGVRHVPAQGPRALGAGDQDCGGQGRVKWGRIDVGGVATRVRLEGKDLVGDDGRRHALSGAKFVPPMMPPNFYAAGLNFRAHIEWANTRGGNYKVPEQADIGYRSNNALIGSGAAIVIPADSKGPVEYEGELVAVIGREAKNLSEANALDCVAGYTLG